MNSFNEILTRIPLIFSQAVNVLGNPLQQGVRLLCVSYGQHLEFVGTKKETSDPGYTSTKSLYQAKDCSGCPLRDMCYKVNCKTRAIEVNHRNNELRAIA